MNLEVAKEQDLETIHSLFSRIDHKINPQMVHDMIRREKVMVVRRKKKVMGAFSYSTYGIVGIFAIMYISKIAVAAEFEGQGVGSLLLSRIKHFSTRAGATAFLLYSLKRAVRFYEKNNLNRIWRFFWWKTPETVTVRVIE